MKEKPQRPYWLIVADDYLATYKITDDPSRIKMMKSVIKELEMMKVPLEGDEFDRKLNKLTAGRLMIKTDVTRLLGLRNRSLDNSKR